MSFLRGALERRSVTDAADTYGRPGFGSWAPGMVWQPGIEASAEGALRLSAVMACQRILSESIATLPIDTYSSDGDRRRSVELPRYLRFTPPGLSRIEYLSQVMLSLLNDGNFFAATPRDRLGEPTSVVPLDPTMVQVDRVREGRRKGQLRYRVAGVPDEFGPLDILHIKGMTLPGRLRGLSVITAAREVLGAAADAQAFGASLFRNHAVPPAVIEVPGGADDDKGKDRARRVAETWRETHGGTANAGKVGVLVGGATLKTVAVTPEDAQWLETRRFGVQEVARLYGVPPHLIADSSNSTSWGSGLAEQNLAFGQFSLRPWIERIEEGHTRLLFTHGRRDDFVKLNLDALLRASTKDRYQAHAAGISARFLTPNEARAYEDLPPLPGGDDFPTDPVPGGDPWK